MQNNSFQARTKFILHHNQFLTFQNMCSICTAQMTSLVFLVNLHLGYNSFVIKIA